MNLDTKKYYIKLDKYQKNKNLNIALIADTHIGKNMKSYDVVKVVKIVNDLNSDIILIAGDIFDNDSHKIDNPDKLIYILSKLKSKYGVYAVYGNHDVAEKIVLGFTMPGKKYKKPDEIMDYIVDNANIKMLHDEVIKIDDFYLCGRVDKHVAKKINMHRKSVKDMCEKLDDSPVILLDHQPRSLMSNSFYVDLELSGHTHNGQIFPVNYLLKMVWKNSYGVKQFNSMYSVVTSGVGTWGPKLRLGTTSEIVNIVLSY